MYIKINTYTNKHINVNVNCNEQHIKTCGINSNRTSIRNKYYINASMCLTYAYKGNQIENSVEYARIKLRIAKRKKAIIKKKYFAKCHLFAHYHYLGFYPELVFFFHFFNSLNANICSCFFAN